VARRMARIRPKNLRPGRSPRPRLISIPREFTKAIRHMLYVEMTAWSIVVPSDKVLVAIHPFQRRLLIILVDVENKLLGMAFSKCREYDPESYYFSEEETPTLWGIVKEEWIDSQNHNTSSIQRIADKLAAQLCRGEA